MSLSQRDICAKRKNHYERGGGARRRLILDAKLSTRAQSVSGGGAEIREEKGESDRDADDDCSRWRMTPNSAYGGGACSSSSLSLSLSAPLRDEPTEDEEGFLESFMEPSY